MCGLTVPSRAASFQSCDGYGLFTVVAPSRTKLTGSSSGVQAERIENPANLRDDFFSTTELNFVFILWILTSKSFHRVNREKFSFQVKWQLAGRSTLIPLFDALHKLPLKSDYFVNAAVRFQYAILMWFAVLVLRNFDVFFVIKYCGLSWYDKRLIAELLTVKFANAMCSDKCVSFFGWISKKCCSIPYYLMWRTSPPFNMYCLYRRPISTTIGILAGLNLDINI